MQLCDDMSKGFITNHLNFILSSIKWKSTHKPGKQRGPLIRSVFMMSHLSDVTSIYFCVLSVRSSGWRVSGFPVASAVCSKPLHHPAVGICCNKPEHCLHFLLSAYMGDMGWHSLLLHFSLDTVLNC